MLGNFSYGFTYQHEKEEKLLSIAGSKNCHEKEKMLLNTHAM